MVLGKEKIEFYVYNVRELYKGLGIFILKTILVKTKTSSLLYLLASPLFFKKFYPRFFDEALEKYCAGISNLLNQDLEKVAIDKEYSNEAKLEISNFKTSIIDNLYETCEKINKYLFRWVESKIFYKEEADAGELADNLPLLNMNVLSSISVFKFDKTSDNSKKYRAIQRVYKTITYAEDNVGVGVESLNLFFSPLVPIKARGEEIEDLKKFNLYNLINRVLGIYGLSIRIK